MRKFIKNELNQPENLEKLLPHVGENFFMVLDIVQLPEVTRKRFIEEYGILVTKIVSDHVGVVHKTTEERIYISFGFMNSDEDLSDIPGIELEEGTAKNNRKLYVLSQSVQAFYNIVDAFEAHKIKYSLSNGVKISAILDFGEVVCKLSDKSESKLEINITEIAA